MPSRGWVGISNLELQALDRLQRPVVGGRLDRDRVALGRHRAQRQADRLGAAMRDDEFVLGDREAPLEIATRQLVAEGGVT